MTPKQKQELLAKMTPQQREAIKQLEALPPASRKKVAGQAIALHSKGKLPKT